MEEPLHYWLSKDSLVLLQQPAGQAHADAAGRTGDAGDIACILRYTVNACAHQDKPLYGSMQGALTASARTGQEPVQRTRW